MKNAKLQVYKYSGHQELVWHDRQRDQDRLAGGLDDRLDPQLGAGPQDEPVSSSATRIRSRKEHYSASPEKAEYSEMLTAAATCTRNNVRLPATRGTARGATAEGLTSRSSPGSSWPPPA